jgi:hypothetical protein
MFYQNRTKPKQHNNRINALPSVAGATLRAAARNAACYAGVMSECMQSEASCAE